VQSYESIMSNSTPQDFALRLGYISDKTDDALSLNHAYTRADIRLIRLEQN